LANLEGGFIFLGIRPRNFPLIKGVKLDQYLLHDLASAINRVL